MRLPELLQSAIDDVLQRSSSLALRKARESLTQIYKEGADSSSIFADEAKRLAYLGARMPATYAAAHTVLQNVPFPIAHLLDLGAGPGTASWAAAELFPSLQKVTLVERSPEAIALGQALAQSHPLLQHAQWIQQSLSQPIPQADAVILSYVLNELPDLHALIERCWEAAPLLILIEPGTPRGFQIIRRVRQQLIDLKAHLIAPCPHSFACPIQGTDWCHFSTRLERTRLHRLLKEGSLGYEDEKFSYLISAKTAASPVGGRVIRHPMKHSGHVRLTLCTKEGKIEEKTISKKDRELYRRARHAESGDSTP